MTAMPLPIGTRVRLASGGPEMLVVDWSPLDTSKVTVAWDGGEAVFPIVCLDIIRRHINLWEK